MLRDIAGLRRTLLALLVGAIDGLVFLGFEWVVKDGTDWLWNDVAGTDDVRWRVIPLAIALSVLLSLLLRALGMPRWTPVQTDPLHASHDAPPPTLASLGTILLVGAASLLAGASLGPEASLVALATALGTYVAIRAQQRDPRVLALASVGALLVAFFGSLIPIALPLMIMYQKTRKLPLAAVVPVVLAGVAAWGTLLLVKGDAKGYGSVPSDPVHVLDYVGALLLGAVAVGLGMALRWFIRRTARTTERIQERTPWWAAASVFGAVLGVLYLVGGPTVQFSGSEGSKMLLDGEYQYGALALLGLTIVKLMATSWSLSAGYRGGLVFPSIFVGVAASLFADDVFPSIAGPGVLTGCVAGLLVALSAPAAGVVMLLAALPGSLLPLGLAGAAGAVLSQQLLQRRESARAARK